MRRAFDLAYTLGPAHQWVGHASTISPQMLQEREATVSRRGKLQPTDSFRSDRPVSRQKIRTPVEALEPTGEDLLHGMAYEVLIDSCSILGESSQAFPTECGKAKNSCNMTSGDSTREMSRL